MLWWISWGKLNTRVFVLEMGEEPLPIIASWWAGDAFVAQSVGWQIDDEKKLKSYNFVHFYGHF